MPNPMTLLGVGGPPGFQPPSIAGLKIWLKADYGLFQDTGGTMPTVLDGDPVGRWLDQSGNSNHALQATVAKKGTLKLGVQNTMPAVRFDGVDDVLAIANNAGLQWGTGGFSVLVALKPNAPGANMGYIGSYPATATEGAWDFNINAGNHCDSIVRAINTTTYSRVIGASVVTTWTIVSSVRNDSLLSVWRDGASEGTDSGLAAGSAISPLGNIAIGDRVATGSDPFSGDIGEVLVYNSNLSAANRLLVEAYLKSRWGTP